MRQVLVPLLEIILSNNHDIKQGNKRSKLFPGNTALLPLVLLDLFMLALPVLA
jgi:hypothetical protein